MYAVFRSGGKQYRAAKGDVLRLEKIEADEGATIQFDEVLLVGEGSDIKVGNPLVSGTAVSGKVIRQGKSKKVSVVKFKRRQNYLRQGSHRQFFTEVEITDIGAAAKKAAPKKEAAADDKPAAKKKAAKKPPRPRRALPRKRLPSPLPGIRKRRQPRRRQRRKTTRINVAGRSAR
jgi:large subunit ribosomal protein L21